MVIWSINCESTADSAPKLGRTVDLMTERGDWLRSMTSWTRTWTWPVTLLVQRAIRDLAFISIYCPPLLEKGFKVPAAVCKGGTASCCRV